MLQESGLGIPPSLSNHLDSIKGPTIEDRDDSDEEVDESADREDSDPEDHPEDHDLIKEEMKKENFGDFKSPFGSLHPSLTATSTMPSIMSPFFTSLAAQANVTGSSKLFSPSEIFGSLESSKAATSAGSASSLARPSPPSSPLKPTAFNLNSLSHGNKILEDQLFFKEYSIFFVLNIFQSPKKFFN